jgi:uncharacterized protein YdaU (DUF1376 family)
MKLYIGDYLGDTSHLSTIEHGAYLLLIMAYWQKGGPLRNTDVLLSNIARTTPEEWSSCKETILEFFEDRNGYLFHGRIDKELHKRADISSKCKVAIGKRWEKQDTDVLPTNNGRNTTPIVHRSIDPDKEEEKSAAPASPPFSLQDELNPNRKDIGARIEIARKRCLEIGGPLSASARKLITHMSPDREPAVFATFATFSDAEIDQALTNLAAIAADSVKYRRPTFSLLEGFLATGVEQFVDAANPFHAYRLQPRAQAPVKASSVEVPDAESTRRSVEAVRSEGGKGVDTLAELERFVVEHPESEFAQARLARIKAAAGVVKAGDG